MSASACIGQPVSWLALERFHLGELPEPQRAEIADHLRACPACQQCLESIQADEAVALPPLRPVVATAAARPASRWRWSFVGLGFASAAAAAAVALVLLHGPGAPRLDQPWPPSRVAVKGGEVAIALVRERAGATVQEPTTFAAGDRFKVLVTCPPGEEVVDVVVHQGGTAAFPFPAPQRVSCANLVPLPGAFTLTGRDPARVCLVASPAPLARDRIGRGTVCATELTAAAP
jgi:anti-sigma factor RsiW